MPKVKTSRKQLFKAALAIAGVTAAQWASNNDLSPEHVSFVLNGKRESARLIAKIDAFIVEHVGKGRMAMAG
jgi:gp16 family phage-associated protein